MNEIHKNNDLFFYVILNPCLFYAQNFEIGWERFFSLLLARNGPPIIFDKIFPNFSRFNTISFHHKWNRTRLLPPESECTSCLTSCRTSQYLSHHQLKNALKMITHPITDNGYIHFRRFDITSHHQLNNALRMAYPPYHWE